MRGVWRLEWFNSKLFPALKEPPELYGKMAGQGSERGVL